MIGKHCKRDRKDDPLSIFQHSAFRVNYRDYGMQMAQNGAPLNPEYLSCNMPQSTLKDEAVLCICPLIIDQPPTYQNYMPAVLGVGNHST